MGFRGLLKPYFLIFVPLLLLLVAAVACGDDATPTPLPTATPTTAAATPTPTPVPATPTAMPAKMLQFKYLTPALTESNKFWLLGRPAHLQNDPMFETLIDLDVATAKFVPRLATDWSFSNSGKDVTFNLRDDVEFHFGWGQFTAADVNHAMEQLTSEEAVSTFSKYWRGAETREIVNDQQIIFHMKTPALTFPYAASRAGDGRMVSKAQWDAEGEDGYTAKPAGTGHYQYVSRSLSENIIFELADDPHWSGQVPDFSEIVIGIAPEMATRLAALLAGEADGVGLSRQLQDEALERGMEVVTSSLQTEHISMYFGGMYFIPGDTDFDPDVPWTDRRVRQAMSKAINRQEILDGIYKGRGRIEFLSGFGPDFDGYNTEWETRHEEVHGYDVEAAKALMADAGYADGFDMTVWSFTYPGGEEHPQVADAMTVFWPEIGINVKVEDIEFSTVLQNRRQKKANCCVWPESISFRPIQEWIRVVYYSQSNSHFFDDEFIDEKYLLYVDEADPAARDALAREIGDYMFETITDIPLLWLFHEVVVNPEVVESWTYPGWGAGRTSHFNLLKSAQ